MLRTSRADGKECYQHSVSSQVLCALMNAFMASQGAAVAVLYRFHDVVIVWALSSERREFDCVFYKAYYCFYCYLAFVVFFLWRSQEQLMLFYTVLMASGAKFIVIYDFNGVGERECRGLRTC